MMTPSRREILRGMAATVGVAAKGLNTAQWKAGTLEIHHISTGRGNSALVIGPDATTILIDAGDVRREPELERYYVSARPDGSRRPGQWLARYLGRQLERIQRRGIDYFLATHLHSDHIGSERPGYPRSRFGQYTLSGIADIAEEIPVRRHLDRGWPNYRGPVNADDADQRNYIAYLRAAVARGMSAERFQPGSARQIGLTQNPASFPQFEVRNLAANGLIWTGLGDSCSPAFPDSAALAARDLPTENMCSAAVRIRYGKFSYYTGGDLPYWSRHGGPPWHDVESAVARACGPVDVASANHHGFVDACGPVWVRTLRPKCFVVQAWTSAHPTMPAIANMLDRDLYPGERRVFATAVRPESRIAVRQIDQMSSQNGHVIVRVAEGGERFEVEIADDRDESGQVTARFGPFAAG